MLSSKQMPAATDWKKVSVIAAPSIVFPFESTSGRLDGQDNRFWVRVSVVLIGTEIEHYSDDLRGLLDAGGSHWIQATLTCGGNPHYLWTSVRSLGSVGIRQGSTIPGDYHIGARKLLSLFMEMNCVPEAGSVISQV